MRRLLCRIALLSSSLKEFKGAGPPLSNGEKKSEGVLLFVGEMGSFSVQRVY